MDVRCARRPHNTSADAGSTTCTATVPLPERLSRSRIEWRHTRGMGRGARIAVSVGIGFLAAMLIAGVTDMRNNGGAGAAIAVLVFWAVGSLCAYALIKPAPR